jgi:hypothetical protein
MLVFYIKESNSYVINMFLDIIIFNWKAKRWSSRLIKKIKKNEMIN